MTEIVFKVPGMPVGQGRPRFGNGRAYKDKKDTTNEAVIANACVQASREQGAHLPAHPKEGTGFDVTIYAYFPIPKALTKAKRQEVADSRRYPTRKPDIDNIAKAVFDALSGKAWVDDSAVVSLLIEKSYGEEPRLEVAVAWEEG